MMCQRGDLMSIRFVIGRAGSGKSSFCLDEIRQRLRLDPQGNQLILLVPEQATFLAEHALVSTPGLNGIIRAQVLSFRRLAWRVMQETGHTARTPIDDIGKTMLLQRILHKMDGQFRLFHTASEKLGLMKRLNSFFSEMKRYCIDANSLEVYWATHFFKSDDAQGNSPNDTQDHASGMLSDKMHDLMLIYREFERELSKQYLEGEDYLACLSEQLTLYSIAQESEVWIDGFYGFTPQELAAVIQCMKCCRQVTITLCLDRPYEAGERPQELNLFHPTAMTMIHLLELAQEHDLHKIEIVNLNDQPRLRYVESPMLAHLERHYEQHFSSHKQVYQSQTQASTQAHQAQQSQSQTGSQSHPNTTPPAVTSHGISIHTAVHRRAEVEGAAREMLRLVRDKQLRWRDMAIRVRSLDAYGDLFSTVFKDYGIPYFLDQKRSIMHHPLVEFIRSSLEVVNHYWHVDAVFRCVKTDFLLPLKADSLIDRKAMDELENYVLAYGIKGYRWREEKSWSIRPKSLEDGAEVVGATETLYRQRIQAASRAVVEPLSKLQDWMTRASSVKERAEALYELLDQAKVPERLQMWSEECIAAGNPEKAREHAQIWDQVIGMLDQLVEIMGEDSISAVLFASVLDSGLESIRLGLVPPSLDQVQIGSIDRTRSTPMKYAFVLGANDGVLPEKITEDGIITEQERDLLLATGLHLADGNRRKLLDESFLIYTLLCTPSHSLWLSYSLADDEGKALLPSEMIKQIKLMFPQVKQQQLMAEPYLAMPVEEQWTYISVPEKTLSYLIVQLKQSMRGGEIANVWWEIYNWFLDQPVWRVKLQAMVHALLFSNHEPNLQLTTSRLLYGQHLQASVSRMERFVACPFAQFISHGLRLRERKIYRLEAPEIGQLFHAALSGLIKRLQLEEKDLGTLVKDQLDVYVSLIVKELTPRLQSEILLSSSRYRYIARKLTDVVSRAASMLAEHARKGAFVPIELELGFGPNQTLPPLTFHLNNGFIMDIVGRIDRVDLAESDKGPLLRIIDYKSSQTALSIAEVFHGLSLQVLTYLDVVITHSRRLLGRTAAPAGVLYFHVHNPLIFNNNMLTLEEIETEIRKKFKMNGLILANREIVKLMDGELESGYSTLIPIGLKTDGSFYKNASVATNMQWHLLQQHVRQLIQQIGTQITEGQVSVEPYRMGVKAACTFCNYKPICKFDPLFEGNGYRNLQLKSRGQVWASLEELAAIEGIAAIKGLEVAATLETLNPLDADKGGELQ